MIESSTTTASLVTAVQHQLALVMTAVNCSLEAGQELVRKLNDERSVDDGGGDTMMLFSLLVNSTTSLPRLDDNTLPDNLIEPVYEDLFGKVVGHFVLPVICIFGIVGILLTVIVLSQKDMMTSTNCYLLALSIADLLFLVMLITVWLDLFFEQETPEQYMFEIYAAILTVFMQVFLTASIWLTVMLAIERYIAICMPYLAPKVCRVRRARIIIVCIYVVAFIAHIPIFFEHEIRTEHDEENDLTITYMDVSEFATSTAYVQVYPWIVDGMIQSILPFLILLLLNTRLIWELRKSTKYIKRNLHVTVINHAQREELQVTLMLVIIVLVFFVCQAPYVVYTAIVSINHYHIESAEFTQFHVVTKLLLTCKAAANFILYCWFSERFATTLRRLCRRSPARHCRTCGQWSDASTVNGNSAFYYGGGHNSASLPQPSMRSRAPSYQVGPSPDPGGDQREDEAMLHESSDTDADNAKLFRCSGTDSSANTPLIANQCNSYNSHNHVESGAIAPVGVDIHSEHNCDASSNNTRQTSSYSTVVTLCGNDSTTNNGDTPSLSSASDIAVPVVMMTSAYDNDSTHIDKG